jgi:hypothetical protein
MSGPCTTRQPIPSSQARAASSTTDSVRGEVVLVLRIVDGALEVFVPLLESVGDVLEEEEAAAPVSRRRSGG